MARKRITQLFPWLLPIRRKQRIFCFYTKMRFDANRYASYQANELLPYKLFESSCPMYNYGTGFDMVYQENKVFNLMLAAAKLDKLIIRPGETFSFWNSVRYADRQIAYKYGLAEIDGKLSTQYGGGLCQISNLLCWLFLHTPVKIVERHGHGKKDFAEPASDAPMGVDATVSEGWLDFRVRNDTDTSFQLSITFDDEHIIGRVFTDQENGHIWQVSNADLRYYSESEGIFEEVDVIQKVYDTYKNHYISEKKIYRNRCEIGYQLPADTIVVERGQKK